MDEKERELLREKHLKRRRKRQLRIGLFAGICVLLLTVITVAVIKLFFCADLICVVNATPYASSVLTEQTGFKLGDAVFLMDKSSFERITKEYPYVKSVEAEVSFPDRVSFVFTYAEPFLSFDLGDEYLVVDRNFKILEVTQNAPDGVCTVLGFSFENVTTGRELTEADDIELSVLTRLVASLEKEAWLERTNTIDFTHIYNITLSVDNLLSVELGTSADLEKKVEMAHYVATQNDATRKARISVRNYSSPRYTLID